MIPSRAETCAADRAFPYAGCGYEMICDLDGIVRVNGAPISPESLAVCAAVARGAVIVEKEDGIAAGCEILCSKVKPRAVVTGRTAMGSDDEGREGTIFGREVGIAGHPEEAVHGPCRRALGWNAKELWPREPRIRDLVILGFANNLVAFGVFYVDYPKGLGPETATEDTEDAGVIQTNEMIVLDLVGVLFAGDVLP